MLLFDGPHTCMVELEKLYVDRIVAHSAWDRLIGRMQDDWTNSMIPVRCNQFLSIMLSQSFSDYGASWGEYGLSCSAPDLQVSVRFDYERGVNCILPWKHLDLLYLDAQFPSHQDCTYDSRCKSQFYILLGLA